LLERKHGAAESPDLYSLTEEQLTDLDRFAKKSAARAGWKRLSSSKKAGLARVLMGLGIRFVGERTAELLARGVRLHRRADGG
jgi:DNA ligase (NAD+)